MGKVDNFRHVQDHLFLLMLRKVQDVVHKEEHKLGAVHCYCEVLQGQLVDYKWSQQLKRED